jgi:hypothetical protein
MNRKEARSPPSGTLSRRRGIFALGRQDDFSFSPTRLVCCDPSDRTHVIERAFRHVAGVLGSLARRECACYPRLNRELGR